MADSGSSATDLVVVALAAVVAGATALSPLPASILRTALVVPLLCFLPGYALVALVYPGRATDAEAFRAEDVDAVSLPLGERVGVGGVERFVLSVVASLALVPLVALGANVAGLGVYLRPIVLGTVGLTLGLAALAALHRSMLRPEDRYSVGLLAGVRRAAGRYLRASPGSLRSTDPFEATTRSEQLLNLALAGSLVLLVATAGFAYAVPSHGQTFTEFYVVTKNDSGDYVAAGYPRTVGPNTDTALYATVTNHEGEATDYTVVAELQRLEDGKVTERTVLGTKQARVPAGGTTRIRHVPRTSASSGGDGTRTRLVYLLYRGSPPSTPTRANAYRSLQLWVSVSSSGG